MRMRSNVSLRSDFDQTEAGLADRLDTIMKGDCVAQLEKTSQTFR